MSTKDPEKYEIFWKEFGIFIKEGMATSPEHFEQLTGLIRFQTLEIGSTNSSFKEYSQQFKEGQKKIYYIIGEDLQSLRNSPHLETFKERGIDVILFADPVDPFMLINLKKFEDFDLVNVTSSDLELPELTKESQDSKDESPNAENINETLAFFKTTLEGKVKEVRTTEQLVNSPARLVDTKGSPSPEIQRAYRYLQKEMDAPEKVLEINPHHPIIIQLSNLTGINELRSTIIEQIYENALLAEGIQPDTYSMVNRINALILAALKKK